jgi:hypothetical protein
MKYIETTIEHLAAFDGNAELSPAPDNENSRCVKIGQDHYMPFIGWMRFDEEADSWVEVDPEDEETMMNFLSENSRFREVTQKEAGEKFSDNVEFSE